MFTPPTPRAPPKPPKPPNELQGATVTTVVPRSLHPCPKKRRAAPYRAGSLRAFGLSRPQQSAGSPPPVHPSEGRGRGEELQKPLKPLFPAHTNSCSLTTRIACCHNDFLHRLQAPAAYKPPAEPMSNSKARKQEADSGVVSR